MHIGFCWESRKERTIGRPTCRWEINIGMDLREIGWVGIYWIAVAQDREGCCEHGNEPSGSIKCWEILEQLRNWRLLKKDSAPWS
jgi:hypothetical protein